MRVTPIEEAQPLPAIYRPVAEWLMHWVANPTTKVQFLSGRFKLKEIKMKKERGFIDGETVGAVAMLSFIIVIIASWITHVVVCLSAGKWGFLIAGAILFPIANIHGIGYWLGYFQ